MMKRSIESRRRYGRARRAVPALLALGMTFLLLLLLMSPVLAQDNGNGNGNGNGNQGQATPTPVPTVGATPTPGGPTATPLATSTPAATATPLATATPRPTATPTATPRPTSTPRPTVTPIPTPTARPVPTEPAAQSDTVRIAFVADTFYSILNAQQLAYPFDFLDPTLTNPGRVLKLIYAEGAELLLHGGDIGYDEAGRATPEKWNLSVDQILGPNFPIFATAGNHDRAHWNSAPSQQPWFDGLGYVDVLGDRYQAVLADPSRLPGLDCSFDGGVEMIGNRATCTYKNITFITSAIGNWANPTSDFQSDNVWEAYLKSSLEAADTPWVICNWHFNQTKLQTGYKSNEAGWKPYEYCRQHGAIIATGHEHSYARTHVMDRFAQDMTPGNIVQTGPNLRIDEGETVAWVSGLGGASLRTVSNEVNNPWWAAQVNATTPGVSNSNGSGVVFCDFGTLVGDSQASCFYKTIDGVVRDRFELVSNANGGTGVFKVPYVETNVAPVANPIGPQSATVGRFVSVNATATDGDGPDQLEYWSTTLPRGLSLSRTSGRISGTPTTAGAVTTTIHVWDGLATTDIEIPWTIALPPTPTPTPTPTPSPTPPPTATPTPSIVLPEVSWSIDCANDLHRLDVTVTNNGPGFATYRIYFGTESQARSMSAGISVTVSKTVSATVPIQLRVDRNDSTVYAEPINVSCSSQSQVTPTPTSTPIPAATSTAVPVVPGPTPPPGNVGVTGPEVQHAVSCLAGNGRVDTNIVNTGAATAAYRIEFQGLSARQFGVAPGDWWRMPITGRPDGTYTAVVKRDGVVVSSQTITIACDIPVPEVSSPEVTVVNACRAGNGYVLFQFVNPTAVTKPYVIEFQNVLNRSTSAAAFGGSVRAVSGRPDGDHSARIRSGAEVVAEMTLTVDCD